MMKRMVVMLLTVGLIFGGVVAWKTFTSAMMKKYMGEGGKQPQTVSTAVANKQSWQTIIQGVGTLRAVRGVDISCEVSGLVEGIYFESGDQVEEGTLLVKLRVDDEVATLAALQAEAHLAGLTYERDYKQLKEKTVAQATVDISIANLEKAKAQVARQEAEIAKKFIRAPFAGRLGIRQVDLGQYINAGTEMVTLQALDPIYFDFYLPQVDLAKIKLGQMVTLTTDLNPDKKYIGKIWALNSKVDQSTRNVLIRAAVDNSELELLPGMYGVVSIDLGEDVDYITIPQTAITYNPYGNTVYIVKPAPEEKTDTDQAIDKDKPKEEIKAKINGKKETKDAQALAEANGNVVADQPEEPKPEEPKPEEPKPEAPKQVALIAEQRFVVLGPTRGDQVAVISGLQEGETVVTSGQMKLQNGSFVLINNAVVPTDDPNPTPHEYE